MCQMESADKGGRGMRTKGAAGGGERQSDNAS